MSKQRLVDTNLIVRYLVQDHEKHARAAAKLFDACDRGDVVVVVLPVVLAECVFVLESFYRHPRTAIASALGGLISSPGAEIGEVALHLDGQIEVVKIGSKGFGHDQSSGCVEVSIAAVMVSRSQ